MNPTAQAFCERCLTLPGLVACALRSPDGRVQQRASTAWFSPGQIQQAMTRLAVAAESLRHQAPDLQRVCWTFEHVQIHLAPRADGACLVVFLENRPDVSTEPLEAVFGDFMNLGRG